MANLEGFFTITKQEADEFELAGYDFDGPVCYVKGTIIVFKRGDTWHAVGETQSNEEVDTVWGECGTTDLDEMLDKIRSID